MIIGEISTQIELFCLESIIDYQNYLYISIYYFDLDSFQTFSFNYNFNC